MIDPKCGHEYNDDRYWKCPHCNKAPSPMDIDKAIEYWFAAVFILFGCYLAFLMWSHLALMAALD